MKNDSFVICKLDSDEYDTCMVTDVTNRREIEFVKTAGELDLTAITKTNKLEYRVVKRDSTIPSYADFLSDGSCSYRWRNVLQNGFDYNKEREIEDYPFANGRLYVSTSVNLFLKRQSRDTNMLTNVNFFKYTKQASIIPNIIKNNFFSPNQIIC